MRKFDEAVVLRVFLSESDIDELGPIYEKIVAKARELNLAGATVHRGIIGFGSESTRPLDEILHPGLRSPVVVELIDTGDNVCKLLPFLDETIDQGLVTIEAIKIIRYSRTRVGQR